MFGKSLARFDFMRFLPAALLKRILCAALNVMFSSGGKLQVLTDFKDVFRPLVCKSGKYVDNTLLN